MGKKSGESPELREVRCRFCDQRLAACGVICDADGTSVVAQCPNCSNKFDVYANGGAYIQIDPNLILVEVGHKVWMSRIQ